MQVAGGPGSQPPAENKISVRLIALNVKLAVVQLQGCGVEPVGPQLGSELSCRLSALRLPLPFMVQLTF